VPCVPFASAAPPDARQRAIAFGVAARAGSRVTYIGTPICTAPWSRPTRRALPRTCHAPSSTTVRVVPLAVTLTGGTAGLTRMFSSVRVPPLLLTVTSDSGVRRTNFCRFGSVSVKTVSSNVGCRAADRGVLVLACSRSAFASFPSVVNLVQFPKRGEAPRLIRDRAAVSVWPRIQCPSALERRPAVSRPS